MHSPYRINLPRGLSATVLALALLGAGSSTPATTTTPSGLTPPPSTTPANSPDPNLSVPTLGLPTQPPPACTDNLVFVEDLTIPDGTEIPRNATIDKRWLVQNAGTCNWDERYRLKLVNGDALGAPAEQALYPARAGAQVTLRIVFTAPSETGETVSAWQAVAPDGTPFGDPIFISIVVTP
jgi:hypothetical protein